MVNKVLLVFLVFTGCNKGLGVDPVSSPDKEPVRDALFAAATENGFTLDAQIKTRMENQRRRVLGKLYLESVISSRVSVSMDEVEEYYKKTKSQHIRQYREFLVLRFVSTDPDSSRAIRRKLLAAKKNSTGERLSALVAELVPSRELIGENKITKKIKNQLLGGPGSVVGPVSSRGQHVLFYLLSIYEKGTTKEQIHIEETLRNQLFAMKAHALRQSIVDSLKSKHVVSE